MLLQNVSMALFTSQVNSTTQTNAPVTQLATPALAQILPIASESIPPATATAPGPGLSPATLQTDTQTYTIQNEPNI